MADAITQIALMAIHRRKNEKETVEKSYETICLNDGGTNSEPNKTIQAMTPQETPKRTLSRKDWNETWVEVGGIFGVCSTELRNLIEEAVDAAIRKKKK